MIIQKLVEIKIKGLGSKIKKARERDSRTLKEICKISKISEAHWRRIEKEENKVLPLETLRKIEKALGVSFEIEVNS